MNLKVLDLASNQIERIEGLGTLAALEDLWLDNNAIEVVENIDHLAELRTLYLEGNKCRREEYRGTVIAMLPKLEKLDVEELPTR